jgi:mRNA interferase HicA
VKRGDVLRHLKSAGCTLIWEGANHSWFGNPQNGKKSSVPRHSEIDDNLVRKICKDLGISKPEKRACDRCLGGQGAHESGTARTKIATQTGFNAKLTAALPRPSLILDRVATRFCDSSFARWVRPAGIGKDYLQEA